MSYFALKWMKLGIRVLSRDPAAADASRCDPWMRSSLRTCLAALAVIAVIASRSTLAASGNPAQEILQKLSERDRREALRIAIVEGGRKCGSVSRLFLQGTSNATYTALWSVACADGNQYAVFVYADSEGSTGLISCADFAKQGYACWIPAEKFREPRETTRVD